MRYSIEKIMVDVRTILDENEVSRALILVEDNDTLSLNTIITQKIADAARSVSEMAPNRYLDGGVNLPTEITWTNSIGNGMGSILLPDNFMRLVIFQMSDWRRPVITPIYDSDPLYFLQKSKFAGIAGGIDKPVCAITTNNVGRALEFYSCREGSKVTIRVAKYLPYPVIDNGYIDLCKNLYTPIIYYIAALVAITYKDSEHGTKLIEIANDYVKN